MDQDMVMLARVRLLSANRRVVRGAEGLWIYRLLAQVEPEVYGSKLTYVLVEESASLLVRESPEQRLALLDEAVEVAKALSASNPYRSMVLERALAAREREIEGRPTPPPVPEGSGASDAPSGRAAARA
ncbi:hypothetical protein ACWGH3_02600 [Streptomyces sp. NPDC054884]|uniref:hypothetical protein n=1 Tax=Streptomyces sp. ME08-AFT2 TaxID=3028683 RepID=UPI0029AF83BE|nr:hypothetical protein [Streptomyces sp. ME08-AFT2]MDX3310555.1 hypothetical protein [Streptomyces sp. ME08-AFT2]